MSSGDDGERPRRSWREIDRLRDGGARREPAPRGAEAQARAREATRQYLARAGSQLFGAGAGDPRGERARAVQEAHGTPGLAAACRAYLETSGLPRDAALASVILDAGESDLVLAALAALERLRGEGSLVLGAGLRSQLRLLAEDADDAVAEAAEALLR